MQQIVLIQNGNCFGLTLDVLASLAGVHPGLVRYFVEFGLLQPAHEADAAQFFEASDVLRLRTIVRLRDELGINLAGVAVVLELLDKIRALEHDNGALRARL
jgi:MerR family transcriptional regulator/heat shock protein HspR